MPTARPSLGSLNSINNATLKSTLKDLVRALDDADKAKQGGAMTGDIIDND